MATKIIKFKGGQYTGDDNKVPPSETVEEEVPGTASDDKGTEEEEEEEPGTASDDKGTEEGSATAPGPGTVGGRRHKKKTVQFKDEDSDSDDSICTVDLLSNDPLFLVLSHFFISKESGDNIATVLEKLNNTLEKMGSSRP